MPMRSRRSASVHRIHPELGDTRFITEQEAQRREARAMLAGHTASVAHLPLALLALLRDGNPDDPVTLSIDGRDVTLIAAAPGVGVDPDGELAAWQQLRTAVADVTAAFDGGTSRHLDGWVTADLPNQIAIATWEHNGATIRAQGPACTAQHRRTARGHRPQRTRVSAVSGAAVLALLQRAATGAGVGATATNAVAVGALLVGLGASSSPVIAPHQKPPVVESSVTTGIVTGTPPTRERTPRPHRTPRPAHHPTTTPAEPEPAATPTPEPPQEPQPDTSPAPDPTPTAPPDPSLAPPPTPSPAPSITDSAAPPQSALLDPPVGPTPDPAEQQTDGDH